MRQAFLILMLIMLLPSLASGQEDRTKSARHNIKVILRATASYRKMKKRYPYYKSLSESKAFSRGVKVLVAANCLSVNELIGEESQNWGLIGFFMPVPPKPSKPLLLVAEQRPGKTGQLLIGLSNGAIVSLDTKDRGAFRDEISKYLPSEFFRQQRILSNETAVIASLRALGTAQAIFRETDKDGDGQLDYGTLLELYKANLIDGGLGSGKKSGYRFQLTLGKGTDKTGLRSWSLVAVPAKKGESGERSFFIDESTVIRVSQGGAASANSKRLDALTSGNEGTGENLDLKEGGSVKDNELAAIESLKLLKRAQKSFREEDKDGDGTLNYGSLKALYKTGLIDRLLGEGTRMGFVFKLLLGSAGDKKGEYLYSLTATPVKQGVSGARAFYLDQTGVIRVSAKGPATAKSKALKP
ncbi:MAG: hypothetical protein P1V97_10375 [Planctomycetota bacterium]|nr:hypothetical protein [Planctomycetota bacterium]